MPLVVQAAGLLVLLLLAIMPAGEAQTQGTMTFDVAFERPEVTLPERGRGDVGVEVKMSMSNVRCVEAARVSVPLRLAPFAKWAGASMIPPSVVFQVGRLGDRPDHATAATNLNIAWDVASAPLQGAEQTYEANAAEARIEGGPCLPSPQLRYGEPSRVRVLLPDREEPEAASFEVAELGQPDPPDPRHAPEGEDTFEVPVPAALVLLAALAALALRRR